MTRNRSYLPRENPDVMYFSLGQVSGLTLHSLFDRKTDTAIDFPYDAMLTRSASDPDVLMLRMPVRGNSVVRIRRDYFSKTLGLPYYASFDDHVFPRAPLFGRAGQAITATRAKPISSEIQTGWRRI